jgi:hypothetical protein
MKRSGIAVKCKALLDDPFYPTISRDTDKGYTYDDRLDNKKRKHLI